MLQDLENNFSLLEKKILKFHKNYRILRDKYEELSAEYNSLKINYEEEKRKNRELAEAQKNIKLQAAIAGNPDHNRLMKNHLNRLIREVDQCIAELQNSGL